MEDTPTQFFVRNFVKIYPDKKKVVEYKNGFYKNKPDILPVDHWLDPQQYYAYVERQKLKKKTKRVKPLPRVATPMRIALPFDPIYASFIDDLNREVVVDTTLETIKRNESLERSRRRSKKNVVDIIACNDFDMFLTFSFSEDRFDIDKCMKRMRVWINNQQIIHVKKGLSRFSYVIVPEYHKDKKAIHFHALFNNYNGDIVPSRNPKTGKQVIQRGKPVFNLRSYTHGFTNMTYIVHKGKTANYVTKYITKDMVDLKGKKRFWYSRDLKKPEIVYNQDLSGMEIQELYENEYFKIGLNKPD